MIDLRIHIGGSMEKCDGVYKFMGEWFVTTVRWELYDISWDKFVRFSKEEAKISAPIRFIWYKDSEKEMNTVNYLFEENPEDVFLLICLAKDVGSLDIFIEHDISDVRMGNGDDEEVSWSDEEEEEVDRPKEDEEPEQSEDEKQEDMAEASEEPLVDENVAEEGEQYVDEDNVAPQADIGDEVVEDAGDGGNDERFKEVFEEGSMAKPSKEAYQNLEEKEAAEREAENSDEECVLEEDAELPDTPVGSDQEWEQWDNPNGSKNGNSKFHGDLEKPPYIWLFQKFNSGLEFKDQLLRYSMKTQYDVKMAKSEANRIAVVCCGKNCKFRVYCSFEPPINKWMVKVCQLRHNHGKANKVSMLKQSVIPGLFREEIRRNISL